MGHPDPYRLLGIEPEATAEEVRAAFRRKVRQTHPDTAAEDGDNTDVQDIVDAYRKLIDPYTRARHDSESQRRDRGVGGTRVKVTHRQSRGRKQSTPSSVCRACGGSGRDTEEALCPECHGRAQITALDRDRARLVRCGKCGGTGRIEVLRKCASCGGSGTSK